MAFYIPTHHPRGMPARHYPLVESIFSYTLCNFAFYVATFLGVVALEVAVYYNTRDLDQDQCLKFLLYYTSGTLVASIFMIFFGCSPCPQSWKRPLKRICKSCFHCSSEILNVFVASFYSREVNLAFSLIAAISSGGLEWATTNYILLPVRVSDIPTHLNFLISSLRFTVAVCEYTLDSERSIQVVPIFAILFVLINIFENGNKVYMYFRERDGPSRAD